MRDVDAIRAALATRIRAEGLATVVRQAKVYEALIAVAYSDDVEALEQCQQVETRIRVKRAITARLAQMGIR